MKQILNKNILLMFWYIFVSKNHSTCWNQNLLKNNEPELWVLTVVGDSDEFAQNVPCIRCRQAPFFML